MNNVKVFVLMAGLTGLVMAIGQALGGGQGAIIALLLSAGMNLFMYWGSSTMVLRSYGAQVVTAQDVPPNSTRWWTGYVSAPRSPCPRWPSRRRISPMPSPPAATPRIPSFA